MSNVNKSISIIIFISFTIVSIYDLLLKPIITTWGTPEKEISMPMAGDNPALTITSTRAILINASKSDVWKWLIQLGADRGGFYSYTFIEKALGYKTHKQDVIKPEFKKISVGDIIRGSIDENSSIIPYHFRVLYVKPEETFVLDNWGTFLLEKVNSQQTRLIIRTQEIEESTIRSKAEYYIIVPLHFIMERRTLMGIKARAEAGENVQLSERKDIFWFAGIVLSDFFIWTLIFIGRGIMSSIIIPFIFSVCWLLSLLIFTPAPLYSIGLLFAVWGYILYIVQTKSGRN